MNKSEVIRSEARPAPARKRLAPDERRNQIVQEAITLLAERGAAFNTRELASRLNISHPLLFRYFSSRDEIVDAVFNTVYIGRLSPDILKELDDQATGIVRKWIRFYEKYAPSIFDRTWVRIFISSALQEDVISRRYFEIAVLPLITRLAEDTEKYCFDRLAEPGSSARMISIELAWMTHSSLFYNGLRRWVYQLEVPDEIVPVMNARIRAHFAGAIAAYIGEDGKKMRAPGGRDTD